MMMSMLGPPLPPSAYGLDSDAAYLDDERSPAKLTTSSRRVSSPSSSQHSLSYWSASSSPSSSSSSSSPINSKMGHVDKEAYVVWNSSTGSFDTPGTTEDTETMTLTLLPIESIVHISTYLTLHDIRNLVSAGSIELRSNLMISQCATVDLWTMKMKSIFPRIFTNSGGGGADGGITFVNNRNLPIPAIRRQVTTTTTTQLQQQTQQNEEDHAINLPLLVSLMPTQYPQCIDPRTLMMEDGEEEDEEFDVNNEDDFLRMMFIGAGIIDRLRQQPQQQPQQQPAQHGGVYNPISRQQRNPQRQLRRLHPILSNNNNDESSSSLLNHNGGSSGSARLFDVYDIKVTDMMLNPNDNDTIKTTDSSTTPPTSQEVVQVIQFVGERVGTGDRCIRSNFPFPPTCRRLLSTMSSSSSSPLLNPLGDIVERINRIDSSSSMVTDDDNESNNIVSSTGRIIMTRCKRTILNKVNSFRKRSLSPLDNDPIQQHHQPPKQQSKILCPFVIPTVISTGSEGRVIVDVTPRFVAYFEVTIVKLSSSSSSLTHHATALQQQQQQHHQAVDRNERLWAMDNNAVNMNNNNNNNQWQQHEERQREGREVRGRQRFNNNHGPPWLVPMMMMPMHPIPLELVAMMNALDWNRPFQLGVVGGVGRRNTGGDFVGQQQDDEHQRRREQQELLRHEQQRRQQRRGLDRWDADARRWRQPHNLNADNNDNNNDDVLPQLSRHECVAIGLSTRYFSPTNKMPGWDDQSFGYHSDDGGTYHGRGDMLRRYGPTYGPGDTVGCGLDYISRRIFFVKNGVFLGYAFGNRHDGFGSNSDHISKSGRLSKTIVNSGLYPTVGIDSKCPIAVNFGERPFRFDLKGFASASLPMSRK